MTTTELSSRSDVRADAKLDSGVGGKSEPGIGEREGVLGFEGVFVGAEVEIVSCHLTTLAIFPLSPLSSSSVSSNLNGDNKDIDPNASERWFSGLL